MALKHLQVAFQTKAVNDDYTFSGYASVFNNIDSYRDIVMPGAFTKSLALKAQSGTKTPILWQHDAASVIGVHTLMREDATGLYIEGQLVKGVQQADEAFKLLKVGAINGISMGYNTVDEEYDSDTNTFRLKEVELWENSLVTFPANTLARVIDVKSAIEACESMKELEKLIRDECNFSMKAAQAFISKIKSLSSRDAGANESIKRALAVLRG